jgi:hypothetical protein
MPDHKVKPAWTGETMDGLLEKLDMFPDILHACPRAYLVPSTVESQRQKKFKAWNE